VLAAVAVWETPVAAGLIPLNAMDPGGAENTARDAEKASLTAAQNSINAWQAAPTTGAGVGRYGDAALAPLEAQITSRSSAAPARATAIVGYLGSVSQSPDGNFSGTGHFLSLFKWVDIRASKAGGSLFAYYGFDLALTFIDAKIVTAQNQKAEYDQKVLVTKINSGIGTTFLEVQSAAGFSIGNSVKIMDDTATAIVTATIVGVAGDVLEFGSAISGFDINQNARVVKLL